MCLWAIGFLADGGSSSLLLCCGSVPLHQVGVLRASAIRMLQRLPWVCLKGFWGNLMYLYLPVWKLGLYHSLFQITLKSFCVVRKCPPPASAQLQGRCASSQCAEHLWSSQFRLVVQLQHWSGWAVVAVHCVLGHSLNCRSSHSQEMPLLENACCTKLGCLDQPGSNASLECQFGYNSPLDLVEMQGNM